MKNDGKHLENIAKKYFDYILRLYDSRSAKGGFIPPQPADFVVPKEFVECKSTEKDYFTKSHFSKSQIALQIYWLRQHKVPTVYLLQFGLGTTPIKASLECIIDFYYSNKGKLKKEDIW